MNFALTEPSKVKALILVDSGPPGLELDIPELPAFDEAEKAYKEGDLDRVAEIETQIWFDGIGRTPGQVNQSMRQLAYKMNRNALSNDAKKLGILLPDTQASAVERLGELTMPVLIIIGEHDTPYMLAAADYMVANIPLAQKVSIEDAAHLPNMDQPEQFQHIIAKFLDTAVR